MKKILISLFLSMSFMFGFSQNVPNPGFEAWINYGNYEDPKNWNSANWATFGLGVHTVTKSTDTYSGNYSVKMESASIMGGLFKVPGTITLGEFDINFNNQTAIIVGGIPFSSRPDKLSGFFKYYPGQGDYMQAFVFLYKHNPGTGMRDTIGTAYFSHADTVDVWTTFETEIIYNSTVEPDSMNIIIMASDITNAVHGSALLVDSLMFEYTTGVREAVVKSKQILTFPNPCNQQITFEGQNTLDNGSLEIYNMSGQLLYSEAATNKRFSVTTRSYPDGIYFYRLNSGADSETGSFIVSH